MLVYYNPDEPQEILDTKHAFLERLGTEAQAADIPILSNQSSTTMKSPMINHRLSLKSNLEKSFERFKN